MLLFGEYTVIDGGPALAIPLDRFSGSWHASEDDHQLLPFFEYLLSIEGYSTSAIRSAMEAHWCFDSSIPQGYGAGSSGALSAAAFDSFFDKKPVDVKSIHGVLSATEAYFHGRSSGLDPLTSYYNQAVLKDGQTFSLLPGFDLPEGFYLYDSLQTRNTKALVTAFMEEREASTSFKKVLQKLNTLNHQAIEALVKNEGAMPDIIREISQLQFEYFKDMIPQSVKPVWEEGLRSGLFSMKLSGAGGGGYFLLYAKEDTGMPNLISL